MPNCLECATPFPETSRQKSYCSARCRAKHNREMRAAGVEAIISASLTPETSKWAESLFRESREQAILTVMRTLNVKRGVAERLWKKALKV